MFRLLFMLIPLLVGSLVLSACEAQVDAQELYDKGETVFIENCARCHDDDGSGYHPLYPNLDGNPVVTLHDPIPAIQTVMYGRGSMPPFRQNLSDEEIAAVLTYIRNAWSNEASIIIPKQIR